MTWWLSVLAVFSQKKSSKTADCFRCTVRLGLAEQEYDLWAFFPGMFLGTIPMAGLSNCPYASSRMPLMHLEFWFLVACRPARCWWSVSVGAVERDMVGLQVSMLVMVVASSTGTKQNEAELVKCCWKIRTLGNGWGHLWALTWDKNSAQHLC